ncbi:MAG: proton-conducting transporter membrane subunit, partial [Anaerolineae bacterium]
VLQTLENNAEMDVDVSAPNGLGRRQPALAAVMTIFMLSLAGIPPLAGFFGKLYVFKAAVDAGWTWLVIVAVLNSALSAYYYLRVTVNMFLGSETASGQIVLTPAWNLALIVASVGTVLVGVWPTPWMALARTTLLALVGG